MKTFQIFLAAILLTAVACGGGKKEIPMDKMAKITVKMIVDGKVDKDKEPKDIANDVIEPYAKAEGFTAADYKMTAESIAKDDSRQQAFGEEVGKLMIEEMMKALGGGLGGMMDSVDNALKSGLDSAMKGETK